VMIYFDRATQQEIGNRLCGSLAQKGHLIIGHSETFNGLKLPLRCLRPSIYQKQSQFFQT
jgi:chemotaxis protein methyltransferase CheR